MALTPNARRGFSLGAADVERGVTDGLWGSTGG